MGTYSYGGAVAEATWENADAFREQKDGVWRVGGGEACKARYDGRMDILVQYPH